MYDFGNRLKEFFNEPRNSARRESLLLNKLSYDLQLAAASSGYYLKTYVSDVDDNGYDVIIDSEMTTKKLQIKSLLTTSSTSNWKISIGLMKPSHEEQPMLIDWTNIHPPGIGGGVLLQEVELKESDIIVSYHYADIWTITLFARGIVGTSRHEKLARSLLTSLHSGDYHDKISLCRSLFLKAKSPEHLLALMCVNSRYQISSFRYLLQNRYDRRMGPVEHVDSLIVKDINKLCDLSAANTSINGTSTRGAFFNETL